MADAPAVPDVFTTIRVQETLEKNYEYIKKIAECQKNGKIADATALTTKLHQNLTALARAADAQLPADLNQTLAKAVSKRTAKAGSPQQAAPCPVRLLPANAPSTTAATAKSASAATAPRAAPGTQTAAQPITASNLSPPKSKAAGQAASAPAAVHTGGAQPLQVRMSAPAQQPIAQPLQHQPHIQGASAPQQQQYQQPPQQPQPAAAQQQQHQQQQHQQQPPQQQPAQQQPYNSAQQLHPSQGHSQQQSRGHAPQQIQQQQQPMIQPQQQSQQQPQQRQPQAAQFQGQHVQYQQPNPQQQQQQQPSPQQQQQQ